MVPRNPLLDALSYLRQDRREGHRERGRVGGRAVSSHLVRDDTRGLDGAAEEGGRIGRRTPPAHVDVDHLAVPVDGPVDMGRLARNFCVGLIDVPTAPDRATERACGAL